MVISVYISPTLQDGIAGNNFTDDLGGSKEGLNNGNATNGGETSAKLIAITHDHTEATSAAYVYYQQMTPAAGETYDGSFDAPSDFVRLVSWGDAGSGVQVEFNWDDITPAFADILKTDVMDSLGTAKLIPASSMAYNLVGTTQPPSVPVAGEIHPVGNSDKTLYGEGAQFYQKVVVPSTELVNGFIEFDMVVVLEFVS